MKCWQCGTLIGDGARELCDACLSEHIRQQRDELLVALRAMVAEAKGDECWATGDGAEVLAAARNAIKKAKWPAGQEEKTWTIRRSRCSGRD